METSKSPRADYRNFKYDKPLLERLRETHGLNTPAAHAMLEAADEIERLRLELDMAQATILVPSQKDDRRTIDRLRAELVSVLHDAALLRAENERLRMAMHEIYEVYAGCDGHLHNTSHPYLMQLIKEMADIAAEHKRVAGGDK